MLIKGHPVHLEHIIRGFQSLIIDVIKPIKYEEQTNLIDLVFMSAALLIPTYCNPKPKRGADVNEVRMLRKVEIATIRWCHMNIILQKATPLIPTFLLEHVTGVYR
jgi:hypothetical protein